MNTIPLRLKYYTGIDIFDVLSNSGLEYEETMEIFKKFGDLPGADVTKVIRCKDCIYYTYKPHQSSVNCHTQNCNLSARKRTKPDDYCSYGRRREKDE